MPPRWFVYLAIAAPCGWLFGRVLWQQEVLDFRDICHYYRPLWRWTSSEWAAGRVPLWCDLDGLGLPLHADPTASIFYPGQLLFALPLSFTTRLNLYVILHLLLAAGLLYRTARAFSASRAGASAAAISYAYGGQVLFQYCNPIFLVGAAWLPLAILAVERTCERQSWRWALTLAFALAMMTLGGDLQLAYHTALLGGLYLCLTRHADAPFRKRASLLAGGLVFAGLLAAVQLLPTAQWSALSERYRTENPRSLWELDRAGSLTAGIFGTPEAGSHHERVYDFSIGPWRWLEFVWPNIGGRMFPEHRRWMTALPAEGRIWSPSLYVGLFPLLAATAAFSLRRSAEARARWLSWMTLLGIIGSLGVYGLGWLWQELAHDILGEGQPDQGPFGAIGGLYWLFVVVLPGYVQFRYPAKLMVLASLGIALLAARGWDQLWTTPPRWLRYAAGAILGMSLVIGIGIFCSKDQLSWAPAEFPFGALNVQGTINDVIWSVLQAAALISLAVIIIRRRSDDVRLPVAAVAITVLDLCFAHGWMISSTSQTEFDQRPASAGVLAMSERTYRSPPTSEFFDAPLAASADRLTELARWEYATVAEKIGLAQGCNVANMTTTLEPADLDEVWRQIDDSSDATAPLAALGVATRLVPAPTLLKPEQTRQQLLMPTSTAYLAAEVTCIPPPTLNNRSELESATARVFFPAGSQQDRRQHALVETRHALPDAELTASGAMQFIAVQRCSPVHVSMQLDLTSQRFLVLADYHAPGWICEITDQQTGQVRTTPIYRTNRVLRGVVVPARPQQIDFHYRPIRLYCGAIISLCAWCGLSVVVLQTATSKRAA